MARRALTTTAAAFATAAALLLTACGGGDDSASDDIKGAGNSSNSPSASASPSAESDVKRPVIKLPSSFQLTFENWTSSDPVEQAVLNDAKEEVRAGYAAIIANDPDSEAVSFYDTKGVRGMTKQWIKSYTDKDLTVIGKLPAFDPKLVMAENGRGASLTYCTDETDAKTRNRKTSKVEGNPAGTNPYVRYSVSLAKSEQGVWQNSSVRGERGKCSR
ncbi:MULTISPECIES: hypothetical protein [Streptomyces]|uniref:hypothetical protein n=1 Tax=Streptomyces TaxID=1883 RepID=UPI000CF2A2C3|nr:MULTISPECIES: hypothetical protein [Streptomyces]PPS68247.1 hypothetical protein BV882_33340 [Streptomyces sp. 46]